IFKLDSDGVATPVHDFPQGEQCNFAPLLLAANGDVLGTSEESSTAGSVFRITDAAAPPQLTVLNPASGPAEGGASVRIQGRHFRADVSTTFGGEAVAALKVQRESLLTVIAPALPPGTLQDVVVEEASDSPGPVTLAGAWFSDFLDVPGAHL